MPSPHSGRKEEALEELEDGHSEQRSGSLRGKSRKARLEG